MTDYSQIAIPEQTPPEEYDWTVRRAEILQLIEEKGHPWGFNYSQLGRRYGVSHEQIRKDFQRIKEWYQDRVGDDAEFSSDLAYKRIVREHMENGDYEKARRALDSWNGWLQDTGEQATEPERHELEHSSDPENPLNVTVRREAYNSDDETDESHAEE